MYGRSLATRLHELTATLFDFEEARMSDGPAYMMNGHPCFALWDDYLVIRIGNESANKFFGDDPRTLLFDLNGKTVKRWVIIATGAHGEEEDLQNYIAIAMLFTLALPPKTVKQTTKKTSRKAD